MYKNLNPSIQISFFRIFISNDNILINAKINFYSTKTTYLVSQILIYFQLNFQHKILKLFMHSPKYSIYTRKKPHPCTTNNPTHSQSLPQQPHHHDTPHYTSNNSPLFTLTTRPHSPKKTSPSSSRNHSSRYTQIKYPFPSPAYPLLFRENYLSRFHSTLIIKLI